MPVQPLPIVGFYNQQRVKQFDPSDAANWYLVGSETGKKKAAMYPSMGRQHIRFLNQNQLQFEAEPRGMFKSVNYSYYVVLNRIYRVDLFFNKVEITSGLFPTVAGKVYFTYIVTGSNAGTISASAPTFACFTDGIAIYVYNEATNAFSVVTDSNAPPKPTYINTFGNRILVSTANSSQAGLSEINLGSAGFDPATCFTIAGAAIFFQAPGIIRQFGVIYNTLYVFTDTVVSPWSNFPSTFISAGGDQTNFPWKNNATYDFPVGIKDSDTLDVNSGIMAWLAQNEDGVVQPVISTGGKPVPISTPAIDTLIQRISNANKFSTPNNFNAFGFLYSYENTKFYRLSIGDYFDTELVDYITPTTSIDYNFDTKSWNRCIEVNGQRNRIQRHIYFGNRHYVTVQKDSTVYEMSGQFYTNDITNPNATSPEAEDAYLTLPFRYERVTPIQLQDDYTEDVNSYVEVDMVFGLSPYTRQDGSYENTQFLIDEQPASDGSPRYLIDESVAIDGSSPVFLIDEAGNYPQLNEKTYYNYYKPIVELFFSDDGGVTYQSADVREFSSQGKYRWRMRWYELGTSYFRVYKLVCVSPIPIFILGGVQQKRRTIKEGT